MLALEEKTAERRLNGILEAGFLALLGLEPGLFRVGGGVINWEFLDMVVLWGAGPEEVALIVRNAQIREVELVIEDHGHLVASLVFYYGGSSQGIVLPVETQCLKNLMDLFEVTRFQDLKGHPCRIAGEGEFTGPILKVGHWIHEKWFEVPD